MNAFVTAIKEGETWASAFLDPISAVVDAISKLSGIANLTESLESLFNFDADLDTRFFDHLSDAVGALDSIVQPITGFSTVAEAIASAFESIGEWVKWVVSGLTDFLNISKEVTNAYERLTNMPTLDPAQIVSDTTGFSKETIGATMEIANAGANAAEAALKLDMSELVAAVRELKDTKVIVEASDKFFEFVNTSAQKAGNSAVNNVINQATGRPLVPVPQ